MQANDRAALELLAGDDPARAKSLGDAWQRHMRAGDFEAAWRVSDEVLAMHRGRECHHLPRHFQWIWNGESLNGKRVLVRCYHGLGDTIQFSRYLPLVRSVARSVTVWAQAELIPLLQTIDADAEFLPLHDGKPDCEYEADVELMEVPHIFRSTVDTVPREIPYLHVTPATLPSDKLNVGIVWRAGDWDERRNVPVPLVRELVAHCDVNWHIIQRGEAVDFGCTSGSDDVVEAARIIAGVDLVISIDSFPAHLAGALAVPTWTLLHAESDWRWMDGREDSPWYPTMRLFRQQRAAEWEPVVRRVRDQLQQLARASADSDRGSRACARD